MTKTALPSPPSEDKRWRIVNATMRRLGYRSDSLIETLHTTQEAFGYLDDTALDFVAESLSVPMSKVYGVATFYHFFNMKPQGKHTCVVCTGTACYIKNAGGVLNAVSKKANVEPGDTSEDGKVSLLTARCLGACGLAPAVVLDGEVLGNLEPEDVEARVERWLDDD